MEKVTINGKEYQLDVDKCKEQGLLVESVNYPKDWNEYIRLMHPKALYLYGYEDNYTVGSHLTLEEYDASDALLKLIALRDWWWDNMCDGWRPDFEDAKTKHSIITAFNKLQKEEVYCGNATLVFPSAEVRDKFYEVYKDLIEEAKMFL